MYKAFHIGSLSHLIAGHSTGWCGDGGDDGGIEVRDGAGVEAWRTGAQAGDGDGVKAAGGEVNEMIGGARMRVWCDCGLLVLWSLSFGGIGVDWEVVCVVVMDVGLTVE